MGRGATAKKWVKNRSAGFDDLHQILHQCQRFARDMHLGSRVDRALNDAGKTSACVTCGLPLTGVYNEFRIPPEFSNHRSGIHLCGGTLEKEDALREYMLERVKDCLNGFSEAFEYDVELEARLDEEAEKEASRGDALSDRESDA